MIDPEEYKGDLEGFLVGRKFDDVISMCYSTNAVNGSFIPSFNKFIGVTVNE